MTVQDIGSIGELIAAIATLGTLFYLASQIRQNTRSVRSASFQSGVDGMNQLNNAVAQDESLARVIRLGMESLGNLTEDEHMRFAFAFLSSFRNLEIMYFHHLQGTATELWEPSESHITALMLNPGVREWWNTNPYDFTAAFTAEVEQRMPILHTSTANNE
jgi:hypothetical protein